MLFSLIGNFDYPSMFTVVGVAVAAAAAFAAWINRNPVRLREAKLQFEHQEQLLRFGNAHSEQMAKLEKNLITSHRQED